MNLTEGFAFFRTRALNIRRAWSAPSEDGRTVALALWYDMIIKRGGHEIYDCFGEMTLPYWQHEPGNKTRIADITRALNHCGGRFKVVAVVA